jgi:ABC-type nitrate/sulfonate/bicarbonate transport system substrate-binding protein
MRRGAMLMQGQAQPDEVTRILARARSALDDFRAETQAIAAQHEQMAAWYAEHGDQAYAQMERHTAAVQQQLLADLDAAFEALEAAVSAVLEADR